MKLNIRVTWRSIDWQGPDKEPFVTDDVLHVEAPILESEIREIARKKYPIIEKVEVIQ
jgi:hypothetical protein